MKMPSLAIRFAYGNRNQLVSAAYPDGSSETFAYDPVGNRTRLVAVAPAGATTNTTTYTYATGNRLVADTSPAGANFYDYDGAGRLTNHAVHGRTRAFTYDFTGRMISLTDTNGSVFHTDALGTLRHQAGPDLNRVTYTAREHLGDSQGWMYYRHRVYSPSIGRFTSADPLEFINGANGFILGKNAPMFWTDPWGLDIYRGRRGLGKDALSDQDAWLTHDFLVETQNGVLVATYSWGTSGWFGSWGKDCDLDCKSLAGIESFSGDPRFVLLIAGDENNVIFEQEYERRLKGSRKHPNLGLFLNCKTEAAALVRDVLEKVDGKNHPDFYKPVTW